MEKLLEKKSALLERVRELRAETGDFSEETLKEIDAIGIKLAQIEELIAAQENNDELGAVVEDIERVEVVDMPKEGKNMAETKSLGAELKKAYEAHGNIGKGDTLSVQFKAGNEGAVVYDDNFTGRQEYAGSVFTPEDVDDIMSLFTVVNTDSNSVQALQWDYSDVADAPAAVADGGYKPLITPAVTPITSLIKKIAGHTVISESVLADERGLLGEVENELRVLEIGVRNKELLAGDGTGAHLLGLTNVSGIQTVSASSVLDGIAQAVANIKSATGYTADAVILDPASWTALVTSQNGTGGYVFPVNGALEAITPWGIKNVRLSNDIDAPIVGAFKRGATVYKRSDINVEVTNSNEDNFVYDLLTVRVWQRLGLNVKRPQAFAKVTVA